MSWVGDINSRDVKIGLSMLSYLFEIFKLNKADLMSNIKPFNNVAAVAH